MKKILTAILVIAMIASIACVAASADDAVVLTAGEVEAAPGTTAIVEVTLTNVHELGVGSFLYTIKVEGLTISKGNGDLKGTYQFGDFGTEENTVMWAYTESVIEEGTVVASYEIEIPADAAIGTEYVVTITPDDDPDNFLTVGDDAQTGEPLGLGGTGVNGKITVVEATTNTSDTDTQPADPTDTVDTADTADTADTGNNNESQDSGEATGSEAAGSEDAGSDTEKPDDGKKAPQTGDIAIIVVAAMIVALGTAIVVKKVNVK